MRNQSILFTFCIILFCTDYSEGNWETYDFPGASRTWVTDVEGSKVVGSYSVGLEQYGFIYDSGNWTTIAAPGAEMTNIYEIKGDNIYGGYASYDGGVVYSGSAFMYDGSNWTELYTPESGYANITGVNDGIMVGGYRDGSYSEHGLIYNGTSWSSLDFPGSYSTYFTGVEGGRYVGGYFSELNYSIDSVDWGDSNFWYSSQSYGFIYDGVNWVTIDITGAINTYVFGIDEEKIVGFYEDASLSHHGFVYDEGSWTIVDLPEANSTLVYGISGDSVVGSYEDDTGVHGFVYEIPEPATFLLCAFGGLFLIKRK